MHDAIFEMGLLFAVLFAGGLAARKLKQSVIPAYILIGLASQGLVENTDLLGTLGSAGLILLLFFIGLEFSPSSFFINWRRTLASGTIDLAFNFPVGAAFGLLLGMGPVQSLYLGAIVYMSSTAIITKTMADNRLSAYPESETVLRVLVFEDLLIAVILAYLAGMGGGPSWGPVFSVLKAAGFFLIMAYVFRKGRGAINKALSVEPDELFIMLGLGFVALVAGLSSAVGVSAAVGAFVAGMLFSETGQKERMEEKLGPFRDLCAALFFLNFGMSIGLGGVSVVVVPALALTLAGFLSKAAGGLAIGRAERLSDRASLGVGVGLMARGEFSIIIASMLPAGVAAASPFDLPTLAAVYVLISGIAGAVAMKEYPRAYFWYMGRKKVGGQGGRPAP